MDSEKAGRSVPEPDPRRRPYEPPQVQWEEDFEPYAFSTCGKMPGQGGACRANKNS